MGVFELLTIAAGVLLLVDWLRRPRRDSEAVAETEAAAAEPAGPQVRTGDEVHIAYAMRCSGEVVAERPPEVPAAFVVGQGEVIEGLDSAVLGMSVGQSKRAVLPPDRAFGAFDEARVAEVDRSGIPTEYLWIGAEFVLPGSPLPVPVRLVEIREQRVVLDANHPLAGKDVEISLTLIGRIPAGEVS
jgi:FKBP-type peptidyl-prolyl cis-trans isomerase 2